MTTREEQWQSRFADLRAFLGSTGRLPRFTCSDRAEQSLGSWVRTQRNAIAEGRLSDDRAAMLRALPVAGLLDPPPAGPDSLERLDAFYRAHNRLPKPTAAEGSDEHALAYYLVHQLRPRLQSGKISKERIERAARIPGATVIRHASDPEKRIVQLRAFIDGHSYLPKISKAAPEDERSLARWAANQASKPSGRPGSATDVRRREVRRLLAATPTYIDYCLTGSPSGEDAAARRTHAGHEHSDPEHSQ